MIESTIQNALLNFLDARPSALTAVLVHLLDSNHSYVLTDSLLASRTDSNPSERTFRNGKVMRRARKALQARRIYEVDSSLKHLEESRRADERFLDACVKNAESLNWLLSQRDDDTSEYRFPLPLSAAPERSAFDDDIPF